jgi:starch phosphorylase
MKSLRFLSPDLPPELAELVDRLTDLAVDLRWTWSHEADVLWKHIDPVGWGQVENPYEVLQNLTKPRLAALRDDTVFMRYLDELGEARKAYNSAPGWYGERYPGDAPAGVAYFSMEFGLGEALPLYAGGLGVLAGDFLKAASDLGVPLFGIGLLYQEGYFRQLVDAGGWQQEVYPYNDSASLPVRPVPAPDGAWLTVPINLPGRVMRLRVWLAQVGRVPLYLLDSNDPLNAPGDRGITGKLYGGGDEQRLIQEFALGIGGWRLIEALRLPVEVCHLNEGHAAFVALERARSFMQRNGCDFATALWATRAGNLFTTHTPVAAGFDRFEIALLEKYGRRYAEQLGVGRETLIALGHQQSAEGDDGFNMACLALRSCARSNGVSRLHGRVSRGLFRGLYPGWPESEVPVGHVTNGVHVPSWDSPWADELWTRAAGKERWRGGVEPLGEAIEGLNDEMLWGFKGEERRDLVEYARGRLVRQLAQRGEEPQWVEQFRNVLDPNVLTIGFARRFTEYKRPNLLLSDPQRLIRLLTNSEHPVQLIVAGKAHPADAQGKRLLQQWVQFVQRPEVRNHAVFLEDYDIALAQQLVQGVDVWINTPRRPWEACGTSGMKVLNNGGLNLSELDGWWAEAYAPGFGWAIGNGEERRDPKWDAVEAGELYRLLEQEVVPAFYRRDESGIPRQWVACMRASMAQLAPQFSANRMVRDYVEQYYLPAAEAYRARTADGGRIAGELRQWELALEAHWHELHLGDLRVEPLPGGWRFELQAYLGSLSPEAVSVQLFADGPGAEDGHWCEPMQRLGEIAGAVNGYRYALEVSSARPYREFTPRLVPGHPAARVPAEAVQILWWSGQAEVSGEGG